MRTNVRSPRSSTVSTASRVVPGISLTIRRSRPSSALTRLDFPTFGRPRIATRIASSDSDGTAGGSDALELGNDVVEQVAATGSVQPGDRDRVAQPEPVQLERERLLGRIVDLVREHDHRLPRLAQDLRDLLVARRHAGARIDDEEHEIRLRDRLVRLLRRSRA